MLNSCLPVSAEYDLDWTKAIGGPRYDTGSSLLQTPDAGYIIVGGTNSTGAGKNDVYLVRTDRYGNPKWNKTYGGPQGDGCGSIISTSDNCYILVGITRSFGAGKNDVYMLKVANDGTLLWSKTFGGVEDDEGRRVIETSDDGFLIVGVTWSFGAGQSDVYLVKTDHNGNLLWSKTYGDVESNECFDIVSSGDGGYVICGKTRTGLGDYNGYLIKIDSSGNQLWSNTYGLAGESESAHSLVKSRDGGYAIMGTTSEGAGNAYWLLKTDSVGNEQWTKTHDTIMDDQGTDLVQINDGYMLIGISESPTIVYYDVWIVRTDKQGNQMWTKHIGTSKEDMGASIIKTSDGGLAITGLTDWEFWDPDRGDLYLIKLKGPPHTPPKFSGVIFFQKGATYTDSVRFTLSLRKMNKTRGRSNFNLTIIDSEGKQVFYRSCSIKQSTNWYTFYLNKTPFDLGEYTITAIADTWNTTKKIDLTEPR